jgi:hypothetical protein
VHADLPLRHSLERDHSVGELLDALGKLPGSRGARRSA